MDYQKLNDSITAMYIGMSVDKLSNEDAKAYVEACGKYRKEMNKYYSRPALLRLVTRKPKFDTSWDKR